MMNTSLAIGTIGIILLTVYVSYRGFSAPQFVSRYMFSSLAVRRDKEHYRLFSSGFVHANWFHLIFNMLSLYSFARFIELGFGLASFLLIYCLSCCIGIVTTDH